MLGTHAHVSKPSTGASGCSKGSQSGSGVWCTYVRVCTILTLEMTESFDSDAGGHNDALCDISRLCRRCRTTTDADLDTRFVVQGKPEIQLAIKGTWFKLPFCVASSQSH